ncbi:hypothetical protein A0H81_12192 [Grifola frondosa]|uniref:DUF8212 domain-containing protein n=1 Tax=Grifola frondosa TaxID=5627 RepID=A0A1C7LSE1_GRIFR|nr:hypothetical protein A0H81_12192 [Grifola frondosa]
MYAWYRDSGVCYAYLDDVTDDRARKWGSLFRRSEWFKRGWTLQELIAPARVVFFAQNWSDIGTRQGMADIIEQITDIDRDVLWGLPVKSSVARRMSWAANRQTTRAEDAAYSLMGLFGVNMPTLYGESEKAFIRLQYEIMKQSNDHSIFAWDWSSLNIPGGLLAFSPHHFSETSATIVETSYDKYVKQFAIKNSSPEHTMTNYGIRIRLPLKPYDKRARTFLAPLACASRTIKGTFPIGILLGLKPGTLNQYVRERCDLVLLSSEDLASFSDATAVEDVYLYVDPHDEEVRRAPKYRRHDFLLRTSPLHARGYELVGVAPPDQWTELDTEGWCLTIRAGQKNLCIVGLPCFATQLPAPYLRWFWGWTEYGRDCHLESLTRSCAGGGTSRGRTCSSAAHRRRTHAEK